MPEKSSLKVIFQDLARPHSGFAPLQQWIRNSQVEAILRGVTPSKSVRDSIYRGRTQPLEVNRTEVSENDRPT